MRPFALFSLSLLALPIAACKEKADAVEHNHDDLLRTIEEQQEELDDQAAEISELQGAVDSMKESLASLEVDV